MEVQKSTNWKDLPKTCVIFITEHDVLQGNQPIYHIRRKIEEMNNSTFHDNADIIYVNAAHQADDALGRLMHDFHCTNADDMYYPELAQRVKFYKTNDKGVSKMCEIMNEVLNEGRAEGERNMEMTIVKRMLLKHKPLIEIIDAVDWSKERIIAFTKENNIPITE